MLDQASLLGFLVSHVWKSHTHHSLSLQEISSVAKNKIRLGISEHPTHDGLPWA